MSIFDVVTKPIRGVGRILRGKFGKGIGDIGDAVSTVGKGVSFVNPLLGGAMVAGGSIAGKGNDPGGFKGWKPFKDTVLPAGMSYGMGRGAQALLGGGGAAAATEGGGLPDPASIDRLIQPGMAGAGAGGAPMMAPAMPGVAAAGMAPPPNPDIAGRVMGAGKGILKGAGRFIKKDPMAAALMAQTGLGAYGAYQEGRALDYQRKVEEEERRRKQEQEDEFRRIFNQSGIGNRLVERMRERL